MNFVGKFDAKLHVDASGILPDAHHHVHSAPAHAPSDAIIVPDADLLFNGDFKRSGVDLVLSRDDHELVVQDYFKGEKRAALASPDGALLTGDIINALAGHVDYAQADGSASAGKVIGHVTKLAGTATAIRNGVSIILNQGDNVEKGDVVQSGSASTLGVTFIDGTVFGLSSNARMVLNEMVYDPNGSDNSSLISLVAGTISFVAGQTAKHGDMKIDTPVATMGIRGTAVLVEIDFDVPGQNGMPEAKFQVLKEPDGTTGSYILFDKSTLAPIAIVDKAGQRVDISGNNVSVQDSTFTPELQKLITDVFALKFTDNTNPQTLNHFTDTLIPQQMWLPVQLANNAPPVVVHVVITPIISASVPSVAALSAIPHINQPPGVTAHDNVLTERGGITGSPAIDTTSGTISFTDINLGDRPTAKATISSFTYQNAQHQDIAASAQELADIHALEEIPLVVVQAPGNTNNGAATWTYNVPDMAFDFLGAGDTLTLTFTAEVDSNYVNGNIAGFAPFTITITGTNDAPVITTGPEKVAFLNVGTTTTGPNLPPVGPTTNKLTFKDPDLTDTHTVSTDLTAATLSGTGITTLDMQALEVKFPRPMGVFESALSAAVTTDSSGTGTGTITWKLADISAYYADIVPAGETLTLTYTVTVKDSQGATSSQNVIVTITGSEPPAVVWVETTAEAPTDAAPGDWNGAHNWETGTVPTATDDVIIITNQLQGSTPFYPVTVKAGATASAHSVTMNDFADLATAPGATAPELDVGRVLTPTEVANGVQNGTLTIGTDISLSADAILKVFGTLSVGTIATILGNSVLDNYGSITLGQGGQFGGSSSITNSGKIEVVSETLDVQVNIANSGGTLQIDHGATLKLSSGTAASTTISGGNLTLGNGSTLDVESAGGATLDGVTVTGTKASVGPTGTASLIEIGAAGSSTLKLDDGTSIKNGNLTIAAGSTLDIEKGTTGPGATLDGVTVIGNGTTSTIDVGTTASGATVALLDDGTSIKNVTLNIAAGSTLDIEKGTTGPGATLDGVTVIGNGTTSTIDVGTTASGATVALLDDGTSIKNATLNIAAGSTLDIEKGATGPGATLDGVTVIGNGTTSTIDVGTTASGATVALLDDGTSIKNATLNIAGGSTLDIEKGATGPGATLDGVTVIGNGPTSTIDVGTTASGATVALLDDGTSIKNATLNIAAGSTLDIEKGTAGPGATLDGVTVVGNGTTSTIDVGTTPSGVTLTLDDATSVTGVQLKFGGSSDVVFVGTGGATLDGLMVSGGGETDIGSETATGVTLTLDGATSITGGKLVFADSSDKAFIGTGGATLDDVTVSGGGETDIGSATATGVTLTLDSATSITGGKLVFADGSDKAFIGTGGATLDDVTVTGGGETDIGSATVTGVTLTLDSATSITGGKLVFADSSDKAFIGTGGATLDDVTVSGGGETDIGSASATGVTLTLDSATSITGGKLVFADSSDKAFIGTGGATLDDVTVSGGGETDIGSETATGVTLTLDGATSITGGKLVFADSSDKAFIGTGGATLDDVTVSGGGETDIGSASATGVTLTLDSATSITGGKLVFADSSDKAFIGTGGATLNNVTVSGGGETDIGSETATGVTLTLDGATSITGGKLVFADSSDKAFIGTGGATLDDVTVSGGGETDIGSASATGVTLTLDSATSITGGKLVFADGSDKAFIGTGGATLDNVTVSGGGETDIGSETATGVTLTLDGATSITGGKLVFADSSDKAFIGTGGATLDDVTVTGGGETDIGSASATGVTLTLDGATSITGGKLVFADSSDKAFIGTGGATLDNVTVSGGGEIDVGSATVTGVTLTLDGATIIGGTINDGTSTAGGIIDVTGDSKIDGGATLNNGFVTVESGVKLMLDNVTVNGTVFKDFVTGGTIQIDSGDTLSFNGATIEGGTLNIVGELDSTGNSFITGATIVNSSHIDVVSGTLTIDPAPVTNIGTIEVKGDSALVLNDEIITNTDGATKGVIQVDADPTHIATLHLEGSTINGGTVTIAGVLNSTGDSFITGATITNTGTIDVTGGTLTIDATSTLDNTGGTLETDGGNLIIDAAIVGGLDIKGGALLELGSSLANAYSKVTVTFEPGATGTLKLDHSETFNGTVAGLDDNTIDLADIAYGSQLTVSYAGDASSGILSIFAGGVDVSNINLTGDYLGVHWSLTDDGSSQHGTDVMEVPGSVAGLDPNGNATQGVALTASITDGGQMVSGATYDWQVSHDGGKTWVDANGTNGLSSYTPVEADEGQLLRVALSFVDYSGDPETSFVSAGVVQESLTDDLVATLDHQTAQQGVTMHVLGVKDGGITVTTGLTYAWQDSSDNGLTWVTVGTHSSYRPGESDEGKLMQLVVTYVDASGSESSTYSLGMPNDLSATLDSTTAQQGLAIHVTGVKDGGTNVSSGVSYAWQISSDDGQHWTTVGTHSSFTPIAADAGETLRVIVTYADSEENESATYSLGTVAPAKEWLGGNHDWQTAGQWATSGVPVSSDNAVVDAGGTYTLRIDHDAAAHSLVVNDFGATVEIVGGHILTVGGNVTIEAGALQIDSGGTLKDIAPSATIAGAFTDNGTIEAAGGKLEIASAVNSGGGTFKIDAGAILQFDHADTRDVAFAGSGELILKDPAHFSGTISDSGGSMTSADLVDVAGFDASATVSYSGTTSSGTVTVSEAGHTSVHLKVGANSTHWSTPVTDGDGGILIHDPPAPANMAVVPATTPAPAATSTVVVSGPNQILTGNAASDTFAFNFTGVGHTTVTDFHPATDTLEFSNQLFANIQAALNATHDDGHGNTVVALDAHDTITLNGVLKAQLQASDFHFV